MIPEG